MWARSAICDYSLILRWRFSGYGGLLVNYDRFPSPQVECVSGQNEQAQP